jgi:hypothetical protein
MFFQKPGPELQVAYQVHLEPQQVLHFYEEAAYIWVMLEILASYWDGQRNVRL